MKQNRQYKRYNEVIHAQKDAQRWFCVNQVPQGHDYE